MQLSNASAYLAGIFITTALLCGAIHRLASVHIDGQGVLGEPLFLVPLGWFSGALALLLALLSALSWIVKRARTSCPIRN